MKKAIFSAFRRYEVYVVTTIIAVVFVTAMGIVALLLRSSMVTPPYEALSESDLQQVFATAYLRFREDDGTPYFKVELHNGTLWWIKKVEFEFEGARYMLRESDAFRPLHLGAVRCVLKRPPKDRNQIEYDLKILAAYGYSPSQTGAKKAPGPVAGSSSRTGL